MVNFTCPGCKEPYTIEGDSLRDGTRLYCSKCGRKLLFSDNEVYSLAFEVTAGEEKRIVACPYCFTNFEFVNDDAGFFQCSACENIFVVGEKLPPMPAIGEETVEVSEPAISEPAMSGIQEPPASEVSFAAGNPLLRFKETLKETVPELPALSVNKNLKVGIARETSGISGFFISVAEKLCRSKIQSSGK